MFLGVLGIVFKDANGLGLERLRVMKAITHKNALMRRLTSLPIELECLAPRGCFIRTVFLLKMIYLIITFNDYFIQHSYNTEAGSMSQSRK